MINHQPKDRTESINPITREALGYSPQHSAEDLRQAIRNARDSQKDWAALPISIRVRYLHATRDYLVERKDELAEIIARSTGKTRIDALATEVLPSVMAVSYYCKKAEQFLKDRRITPGNIALSYKRSKIIQVPYGVIGIVSPWNYPFSIAFSEVVIGLLAGNAVILKTATETQMVGLALKESIEAASLPQYIFSYVNMPGFVAGEVFLEKNGINKLFFTGSVNIGKKLMAEASETLTPVCLELGGNDAMLVCEDADLHRAATGAVWAGFQNAGQSCGGVERIYVHESVYRSFMIIFKEKVQALRVGYDLNYNIDMGALTVARQIETVKRHIEEALSKGAKIFAQSGVPDDKGLHNFIPAMVLSDVNHEMLLMQDETFGPVVGVMKVRDMEEAVMLANDSCLGLTGSIWSKNRKKAERIARKIEAGVVTINDHLMSHGLAETSWGGFKESGIGRTHGELGFKEMTQPQTIVHDIFPCIRKNFWWHPYERKVYLGLRGLIDMFFSREFCSKLQGLWCILKILPRIFRR